MFPNAVISRGVRTEEEQARGEREPGRVGIESGGNTPAKRTTGRWGRQKRKKKEKRNEGRRDGI